MKIDRNLNLVLTVERDEGEAYVYSSPISAAVFERYFLTISKTYAAMIENGGEWLVRMGPRTAKMMLKRIAEADGVWAGPEGVEAGLMSEIRRLSTVLMLTDAGWDQVPLQHALSSKYLSAEDAEEVENAVTFFIVGCASMRRREADALMSTIFGIFGASTTSLTLMDFQNSLPTSKPGESIGAKAAASSIPR